MMDGYATTEIGMQQQTEYFAKNAGEREQLRLAALERQFDGFSERRMRLAGLAPGKRCLELGAGNGGVARIMGEVSGVPAIAADLDPQFLDPKDSRYTIRKVDVTAHDAFEGERYDLIHCRFLLMHLKDPRSVITRLVSLLAPGGALVVEEPNCWTGVPADPREPGADKVTNAVFRTLEAVDAAGLFRTALGPLLPALFTEAGLSSIDCEGLCRVAKNSSDETGSGGRAGMRLVAPLVVKSGRLTQAEVDEADAYLARNAFHMVSMTLFSCIGIR
jgi:2-polyprenyl-3-methyl-5-hydroxy-6-metoxy-1,4-benzoquinol methylase